MTERKVDGKAAGVKSRSFRAPRTICALDRRVTRPFVCQSIPIRRDRNVQRLPREGLPVLVAGCPAP